MCGRFEFLESSWQSSEDRTLPERINKTREPTLGPIRNGVFTVETQDVINRIANAKKTTPIKVYLKGQLDTVDFSPGDYYGNNSFGVLFCTSDELSCIQKRAGDRIQAVRVECDRRNSALPLADLRQYNARIEPGAIVRDMVEIGDNAIIMMGAVLNIGAVIGARTMIDMNVVVGGRAQIGENCHIGAGAVVAGVIEPPSAQPVVVEDGVMVGANAVLLEGIRVGRGAVVAAGAVVTKDVEPGEVVAGIPARVIKTVTESTQQKTQLVEALRGL